MPLTSTEINVILVWIIIWIFSSFVRIRHKNDPTPIFVGSSSRTATGIIVFFILLYSILWIKEFSLENLISIEWALTFIFTGYILLISGLIITIWAVWWLGRLWNISTSVASNYPMLQNGPYAFVRHPVHLGRLLIWLGSALIFLNPLALFVGLVFLVPLLKYQIRIDKQNLIKIYGELYKDYQNHTGGLFPKIW